MLPPRPVVGAPGVVTIGAGLAEAGFALEPAVDGTIRFQMADGAPACTVQFSGARPGEVFLGGLPIDPGVRYPVEPGMTVTATKAVSAVLRAGGPAPGPGGAG